MKTKHSARSIFSLGLALLFAGCGGNRESKLIGSWKARPMSVVLNAIGGAQNGGSAAAASQAAQAMAQATIDIRADKTFTLNFAQPMECTWTWSEDTGTMNLSVSKVNGQAVAQTSGTLAPQPTLKAKMSDDDSMLTLTNTMPSADGGIELNFEKS